MIREVDILSIVRAYGLSETYPKEVMDEAKKFRRSLQKEEIQKELDKGRMDLRQVPMVTIDGEDARIWTTRSVFPESFLTESRFTIWGSISRTFPIM